jgi:hypothetical protein
MQHPFFKPKTRPLQVFHSVRAPTAAQLQALLTRIIKRIMRLLTRKGYLIEGQLALTRARRQTASKFGI